MKIKRTILVHNDLPVCITFGLATNHLDTESPKNKENPKMKRFLVEFRSACCKFDIPTAAIIPVNGEICLL